MGSFHSIGGGHEREINGRLPGVGGCVASLSCGRAPPRITPAVPAGCTHRTTRATSPRTHGGAAGPTAAQPQEAALLLSLSLAVFESSTPLHINCSLCQEYRAINQVLAAHLRVPQCLLSSETALLNKQTLNENIIIDHCLHLGLPSNFKVRELKYTLNPPTCIRPVAAGDESA